jgi:hypothetical protein
MAMWFNPWSWEAAPPHPHHHGHRHQRAEGTPAATSPQPPAPAPHAEPVEVAPLADKPAPPATGHADTDVPAQAAGLAAQGTAGAETPPAIPSPQTMQKLQQMQDDHRNAEDGYLQKFESFLEQKKDQVFSLFHYIFGGGDDKNPQPEKGPEGNPRLESGGETAEQRAQRLAWEDAQKKALQDQQHNDDLAFTERARQQLGQINTLDPTQNRRLYDTYSSLQTEEDAMKRAQAEQMSRTAIAGLPDPAVPGRSLSQFVDDGWGTYDKMVATNRASESASPEGRQVDAYLNYVLDHPYSTWGGGLVA